MTYVLELIGKELIFLFSSVLHLPFVLKHSHKFLPTLPYIFICAVFLEKKVAWIAKDMECIKSMKFGVVVIK